MSDLALGLEKTRSPAEFNLQLANLGIIIGTGEEFQKYWHLAMSMLENELKKVFEELNTEFNNIANELNNNCQKDSIEYENRLNAFKDAVSKTSWTNSDITLSPSQFYNKFFASCLNVKSLDVSDWRNIYEHIGPSSQCSSAEKRLNEVIGWNICYICGNEIEDGLYGTVKKHETRECEHILPAFTALGFKGLIQSTKQETWEKMPEYCLKFFRYEYANSHRCCNRIKSGEKFIKYNSSTNLYENNDKILKETLGKIYSSVSGQYDCGSLMPWSKTFVIDRSKIITDYFLTPLLELINFQKKEYGDLFDLNIRINQVSALRINIDQIARAMLTGETTAPPKQLKTKTYTNLQAKNLLKKQMNNPINLFFEVFKDIFSQTDEKVIEIMFSIFFDQELRSMSRISRKVFELGLQKCTSDVNQSFQTIVIKHFIEAENEIDLMINEDNVMDEEALVAFNNTKKLELVNLFTHFLYYIINKIIEVIMTGDYEQSIKDQLLILQENIRPSTIQSLQDTTTEIEEQNDIYKEEIHKTSSSTGGSKKIKYYMKGGTPEEEMIDSYKYDILQTAIELNYDPEDYGIIIYRTATGRASLPVPRYTTIDGQPAVEIQGRVFKIIIHNGEYYIQENHSDPIPLIVKGQRRGIMISDGVREEYLNIMGGKKKIFKKNNNKNKKNTRKIKNIYSKKYIKKSIKKSIKNKKYLL